MSQFNATTSINPARNYQRISIEEAIHLDAEIGTKLAALYKKYWAIVNDVPTCSDLAAWMEEKRFIPSPTIYMRPGSKTGTEDRLQYALIAHS